MSANDPMDREVISFCRICTGGCGVRLRVSDDGRVVDIAGDKDSALSKGYMCFKGLQVAETHHGAARLLQPMKRGDDGSFEPISIDQAFDEIAAKLERLISRDGPDAVGVFCGNGAILNSTALAMQRSFLKAIGSKQYFSTLTIDQSAKLVSAGRLGVWDAGIPEFNDMEVALFFGANPLVSHAGTGMLNADPIKRLKQARARGLKLIVIDPRFTETAAFADLVLQPFPGQDPGIAGALLRIVLDNGWEDREFCNHHVGRERIAALRQALEPFSAPRVEESAGLQPGDLFKVAKLFARDARVGCAYGATGPNMGPHSNLAQHLIDCLNVICGRFLRAGDPVRRINILNPPKPAYAEVVAPARPWDSEPPSRIRGAETIFGERPSGTLSDEILTPGRGQIRALIVDGGDLATSLPDQARTIEALRQLELLVAIEPWPSPTADFAHYVLPPVLQYERADLSLKLPGRSIWPGAWAQYTPAVLGKAGAQTVDDWYVFWSIAKRLGRVIVYDGKRPLDMTVPPTTEDLLDIQLTGSYTSLAELRHFPHGRDFDPGVAVVQPGRGRNTCFDVMPADVSLECEAFAAAHLGSGHFERDGRRFGFLLCTRRMRDFFNSTGMHVPAVRTRNPFNPAFLNPADLEKLGVSPGDRILLESAHGRAVAIAAADPRLRPGVVSIAHGWGGRPGGDDQPSLLGTCVNRLTETQRYVETINAMPQMTAVPVNVSRAALPGQTSAAETAG